MRLEKNGIFFLNVILRLVLQEQIILHTTFVLIQSSTILVIARSSLESLKRYFAYFIKNKIDR